MRETVLIIGAGPAGLTAALELLRLGRGRYQPVILEASNSIGGLARTVRYKGNRMDIGGHRFFSKSPHVMQWWLDLLPIQTGHEEEGWTPELIPLESADPENDDLVMLVRQRKSRIYFLSRFFDYPIQMNLATLRALGLRRTIRCVASYLATLLLPRRKELTLEDFLINRFGRELYRTFFLSYTEKVWGVPPNQLSAAWGAQRIKGLSLAELLRHFLKSQLRRRSSAAPESSTATSLIDHFLYPKLGPGQLWEHVACEVIEAGGEIHLGWQVDRIFASGSRITSLEAVDSHGIRRYFEGSHIISTMPVRDLLAALDSAVPPEIRRLGDGLLYRDFLTIGLLVSKLRATQPDGSPLADNWIYIQEPGVSLGRVQIYNNWSPWLVADPNTLWLGLEYFCNSSDPLWQLPDAELTALATRELESIGLIDAADLLDAHIVRMEKTYPAYLGTFQYFDRIRDFTDSFTNLYLIGRNGMHRYNNIDHSMLTAFAAVDNILTNREDKANLWAVNTDSDYQEDSRPTQQHSG